MKVKPELVAVIVAGACCIWMPSMAVMTVAYMYMVRQKGKQPPKQ